MTTDEVIAACVAIIRRHAGQACQRILLFGSRARGDAHVGSDVDLAIDAGMALPVGIMARIHADVDDLRTLQSVDVLDVQRVSPTLRAAVLQEGRVVYEQPAAAA
jgi:predicted nucleotidyltransferase